MPRPPSSPSRHLARVARATLIVVTVVGASSMARADRMTGNTGPGGEYLLTLEFEPPTLYAGNASCELLLVVGSESGPPPGLVRASAPDGSMRAAAPVRIGRSGVGVIEEKYRIRLDIDGSALPRRHLLDFELSSPRGTGELWRAGFDLPVGVRKDGLLKISAGEGTFVAGASSREHSLDLWVHNQFPEYDVHLERLDLSAIPDYLVRLSGVGTWPARIEDQAAIFDPPLTVGSSQRLRLPVKLALRSPQFLDTLHGVENAGLSFALSYVDSGGRRVSDVTLLRPMHVALPWWSTLTAILLGLAVGTLMAFYVYLGRIRKRRTLALVVNAVAGALIVIVLLFGQLEFSIFSAKWNYENPLLLFVVAVVAAFGGMPLFKKFFRLEELGKAAAGCLVLGALGLAWGPRPALAQPRRPRTTRTPAPAPPKVSGQAALEKGMFLFDSGDTSDNAAKWLRAASPDATAPEAEAAQFHLGAYYHRKFYIEKDRAGVRDWAQLYLAEREYRAYLAKFSAPAHRHWLADAHFALCLIHIERGKHDKLKAAIAELGKATALDATVAVYQVVWSRRPEALIDFTFPSGYLVTALASLPVAARAPASVFAELTTALKRQKGRSYAQQSAKD